MKELLEADKLSSKVIPIIEPVKFSSTFFSTLAKFIETNHPVIVVRNPKVGSFRDELVHWQHFSVIPNTIGLGSLIECYDMGKFSGLGVIKNLH